MNLWSVSTSFLKSSLTLEKMIRQKMNFWTEFNFYQMLFGILSWKEKMKALSIFKKCQMEAGLTKKWDRLSEIWQA